MRSIWLPKGCIPFLVSSWQSAGKFIINLTFDRRKGWPKEGNSKGVGPGVDYIRLYDLEFYYSSLVSGRMDSSTFSFLPFISRIMFFLLEMLLNGFRWNTFDEPDPGMSFKLGFSKAKQHTARQKPKATTLSSNYSYVSGHFKNSTYKYHIFNPVDFWASQKWS